MAGMDTSNVYVTFTVLDAALAEVSTMRYSKGHDLDLDEHPR
jgi:hypothetical protein